jgi:hypothetical protein
VGLSSDAVIELSSIYLALLGTLDHGFYSASNRNEYQNIFLGLKHGRCVRLTALLPSVSRLSTICGILDISQ